MSLLRRVAAALSLCLVATVTRTYGQACGPDQVTPWWPSRSFLYGGSTQTAADRKFVETQFAAVEALLRKTPYATPRGFAVRPTYTYPEVTDRTELARYSFALVTFKDCRKYDEHGADIDVVFNPQPMAWSLGDRPLVDENGTGIYTEGVRTPTLFDATATFGRFQEENGDGFYVLFAPAGQSPTLPVTREEYLRAMIFTLEGKDQAKVKDAAAVWSKTPYERWMAEAPERKKRNEELYAIVGTTDPARAAKMRVDMEKAEQAATEMLKLNDAYEQAQVSKNLAAPTTLGDKYRAQIAAMTAQERTSPAFIAGFDLVPAGTPNANALVKKNPAFYRTTGSPLQPRLILVHMPGAYPEYRAQQQQLYQQLDWAAIKKMVK